MGSKLEISLACGDYDRTQALADGRISVEGAEVRYLTLSAEEVFFRMVHYGEFDVSELSLSTYVLTYLADRPFVAIPVFPSRMFRHNGIYVNTASGIQSPADLVGRTVGVPEYQMTAAVWIRGILAEHHGVPVDSVHYRTGGLHQAGRVEKVELDLPPGVDVQPCPANRTLSEMLLLGEIDALYSARMPLPFAQKHPNIRRLFDDPREVEARYFRETGIFPIMHTVVIRRAVYEDNRWLAQSLVKAFGAAKSVAMEGLGDPTAPRATLPWLYDDVEQAQDLLGKDYWSYGVPANSETLTTFLRYSHEQGIAKRKPSVLELFAPETLETTLI